MERTIFKVVDFTIANEGEGLDKYSTMVDLEYSTQDSEVYKITSDPSAFITANEMGLLVSANNFNYGKVIEEYGIDIKDLSKEIVFTDEAILTYCIILGFDIFNLSLTTHFDNTLQDANGLLSVWSTEQIIKTLSGYDFRLVRPVSEEVTLCQYTSDVTTAISGHHGMSVDEAHSTLKSNIANFEHAIAGAIDDTIINLKR